MSKYVRYEDVERMALQSMSVDNGEWAYVMQGLQTFDIPTWIPCKERMPSKPKNYPHCEIRRTYYLVSLESGCVKTLGYEFDRDEWQYTASRVLAWMPLPEPWKGADDEVR